MLSARGPLQGNIHTYIEQRGWKNRFHVNKKDKREGVGALILDKTDFETKATKKKDII